MWLPGTSATISGEISGGFSVTKTGTGTLILTGANTYTGSTTVSAGTLQVGNGTSGSIANTSSVNLSTTSSVLRYRKHTVRQKNEKKIVNIH